MTTITGTSASLDQPAAAAAMPTAPTTAGLVHLDELAR
jgi:hypothetical protein